MNNDPVQAPSTAPAAPVALAATAALACGAGAAVQSRANGVLAQHLGMPAHAALWSFGSGWVLLCLGLLVLPSARRGLVQVARAVRDGHLQWWEVVGGLFGAFFVAVQSLAVPQLGVALFTISMVAGQTGSALLVDRWGLGPAGRSPVTPGRVVAALATLGGVAISTTARSSSAQHQLALGAVVLTVVAGAGMSVQQAINGKVNVASGRPVATTFVNFSWGLLALTLWAAGLLAAGRWSAPLTDGVPWWSLVGGVLGVGYIAAIAVVVRVLGVLVTALMALTGQLVTALVLDVVTGAARPTARLLLGVLVTLLAAGGAGLTAHRAARARARQSSGPGASDAE